MPEWNPSNPAVQEAEDYGNVSPAFTCPKCGAEFGSYIMFDSHLANIHGDDGY